MKKTFIFYSDWIDYTNEMTNDEKGILLQTILDYQNGKTITLDNTVIRVIWPRIKNQINQDNDKWETEKTKRSEAGKKGMEHRWNKDSKSITPDNSVITLDNSVIKNITKITDNVNVNVNDNVNNKVIINDNIQFEDFWELYPNKKSKSKALELFNKAIKTTSIETIMEGLNNYILNNRRMTSQGKFCPEYKYPATWLNQQCWNDEYEKVTVEDMIKEYQTMYSDETGSKPFKERYGEEVRNSIKECIFWIDNPTQYEISKQKVLSVIELKGK